MGKSNNDIKNATPCVQSVSSSLGWIYAGRNDLGSHYLLVHVVYKQIRVLDV
jgi:hypothetical protein